MTDFTWPLFEREPLDGNRAWSATFESYDQYHDVVYYALELVEGEGVMPSPAVTVKLGMEFAPDVDNWMTPDFVPALRAALEKHAAAEPRRSPFLELAELRNITTADAQLADGSLDWDVEPDGYQRLRWPAQPPIAAVLRLMARRGLEPALVSGLLSVYPARPVERALIAYDALGGPLLGNEDGALADQLLEELVPIKGFATGLAAVPQGAIAQLVEAVRGAALSGHSGVDEQAHDEEGNNETQLPSLAAARDGVADDATRDALFAHVRVLARARLGSLALAFLQILVDRYKLASAHELLVEIALDHDALAAVPLPAVERDARSARLQAYMVIRASLLGFDLAAADRFIAELDEHPEVADPSDARFALVKAQLAVMRGQRLDPAAADRVNAISDADPQWRFAQAVADGVAIADAPEFAAVRVENYLTTFSNDARMWGQALLRDDAEVRPALAKLLSRELRYASHDPEVWRALSLFSGNTEIGDEVDRRLAAQLHAALTS